MSGSGSTPLKEPIAACIRGVTIGTRLQFRFRRKAVRYELQMTAPRIRWEQVLSVSWTWWGMSGSGRTNTWMSTPAPRLCAAEATISHKAPCGTSHRPTATISTESFCSWPPAKTGQARLDFAVSATRKRIREVRELHRVHGQLHAWSFINYPLTLLGRRQLHA